MIHKDLLVWKKSMELVVLVYGFTNNLPKEERFGLISQMQRSAVSVPSNISEGAGRSSKKDFRRFLYNALGSLNELDTQYQICLKLKLCNSDPELYDKLDHAGKLLMNLIKSIKPEPQSHRVPESPINADVRPHHEHVHG